MTLEELFRHLLKAHGVSERDILVGIVQNAGNEVAYHEGLHTQALEHTHDAQGDVAPAPKLALGKPVVYTTEGWALDMTTQETLVEFNSLVNSQELVFIFNCLGGEGVELEVQTPDSGRFKVTSSNFVDGVKLLLGTAYEAIERTRNG